MTIDATRQTPTPQQDVGRLKKGHVVIEGVSISFNSRGQNTPAVQSASTEIRPGEFVCLLGPSGCGKSTLLNAIAGFIEPNKGVITLDGEAITAPGPDRGMVFQHHSLFPWKTVLENISFGPRVSGHSRDNSLQDAKMFLEMIRLAKYGDRYPKELSGGMQQRVGIARALVNMPSVLLMDEPFGALDSQTRTTMQENLLNIWDEIGTTVVFVTHDIDEALFLADRVLILSAGPGRVLRDITVPLARPRDTNSISSAEFVKLRAECIDVVRSESLKAFEKQND